MKINHAQRFFICFLVFGLLQLTSFVSFLHAGGAVAARQSGQKQMMQKQRAQQAQQNFQAQQGAQVMMQEKMKQQQQLILQKQQQEHAIIERTQQKSQMQAQQLTKEQVRDVVDLEDMVASLETSSRAWPLIIDQEAKSAVVGAFIDQYRRQGVTLNKSTVFYADMIDAMSQETPDMLNQPFSQVLQILAILEYDFNNGQNKDTMALKVLGSQQAVAQNKKRLGI